MLSHRDNIEELIHANMVFEKCGERICAEQLGLQECAGCGQCCTNIPCCVTSEDITRIANHLGISEQEFFNTYCTVVPNEDYQVVALIRNGQQDLAGKLFPRDRRMDADFCIFLEPDFIRCRIYHIKPEVGNRFVCWERQSYDSRSLAMEDAVLSEKYGFCPNQNG